MNFKHSLGDSKAVITDEGDKKNNKSSSRQHILEGTDIAVKESSEMASSLNQEPRRGMVLPFQPLSFAFNHISYYVDMPALLFHFDVCLINFIGSKQQDLMNLVGTMYVAMRFLGAMNASSVQPVSFRGPSGALSPIPENNVIAVNTQGDLFLPHLVILVHIVGMWFGGWDNTNLVDCKSGKCTQVIDPTRDLKLKGSTSWVGCVALDASGSRVENSAQFNVVDVAGFVLRDLTVQGLVPVVICSFLLLFFFFVTARYPGGHCKEVCACKLQGAQGGDFQSVGVHKVLRAPKQITSQLNSKFSADLVARRKEYLCLGGLLSSGLSIHQLHSSSLR
ncbi:hypothetical protein JHK87_004663 [Glycine soja]|nr:hypothetical protein JHK87_004663 [Glycine soja]